MSTGLGLVSDGLLNLIYYRCGKGGVTEVYLHGPSLMDALEDGLCYPIEGKDRKEFTSTLWRCAERGWLQSRGPHAWALTYCGIPFRTIPGALPPRESILERDEYQCRYCAVELTSESFHVDHVFPKSRGGWDDAANVVSACASCNIRKGARTPREWREADWKNGLEGMWMT